MARIKLKYVNAFANRGRKDRACATISDVVA